MMAWYYYEYGKIIRFNLIISSSLCQNQEIIWLECLVFSENQKEKLKIRMFNKIVDGHLVLENFQMSTPPSRCNVKNCMETNLQTF